MIKTYCRTDTIRAEQFDGSNAMIGKYHISVYNENIDKYGGLGKSTPNEYIFNGIQQAFTAHDSNPYARMIFNIK